MSSYTSVSDCPYVSLLFALRVFFHFKFTTCTVFERTLFVARYQRYLLGFFTIPSRHIGSNLFFQLIFNGKHAYFPAILYLFFPRHIQIDDGIDTAVLHAGSQQVFHRITYSLCRNIGFVVRRKMSFGVKNRQKVAEIYIFKILLYKNT